VRFIPGTFNLFNPVYNTVGFDGVDVSNRIAFGVDNTTSWYGLYAQDQIELPHNVFVLGGFRYDQADQYDHLTSSVAGDDNRVSPRGGLLWRPIPELSLYGSYTENFGAQNGINGNGQMLHMLFKLGQAAEKTWRRQRGFDYLAKVITGVPFKDGIELEITDQIAA